MPIPGERRGDRSGCRCAGITILLWAPTVLRGLLGPSPACPELLVRKPWGLGLPDRSMRKAWGGMGQQRWETRLPPSGGRWPGKVTSLQPSHAERPQDLGPTVASLVREAEGGVAGKSPTPAHRGEGAGAGTQVGLSSYPAPPSDLGR